MLWIIWGIVVFAGGGLSAQSGLCRLRNYPPAEYGAHNQNWAIAQDRRGIMYFGNSNGLLEYDGVSWRRAAIKNARIVRSLAVGADNRLFAGGYGELGYLAPDSVQQLQFVSLLPKLAAPYRDFADVWQTLALPDGIYFVTEKYVFRWDGQTMRVWPSKTGYNSGFVLDGRFYVQVVGKGLMQMTADSLQMVVSGEKLVHEQINALLPYDHQGKKGILIATRNNGLLLYDGHTVGTFFSEAGDIFRRSKIFCAIPLSAGRYAIGTMEDGVIITDATGRVLHHLRKSGGLQDDAVLSLFEDRQRGLWMGLQAGISRAETGSPFRYYSNTEGVEGSVWEFVRHQGRLYFASIMGLFALDERNGQFRKVTGVPPQCWALLPFGQSLLVGTFDGAYEIRGPQVRRIADGFVFALHRSRQDSNRVFMGMRPGAGSLYFHNGQWRNEGRLEGLDREIRHIYETSGHRLWLVDYFTGLYQADFSTGYTPRPPVQHYDVPQGLPPADRVVVFQTDKGLRFATLRGVYLFDEAQQRFFSDTTLIAGLPLQHIALFSACSDRQGNLWMIADNNAESGVAIRRSEGSYAWDPGALLRIAEMPVTAVYSDPLGAQVIWLGSTGRVVRYDGAISRLDTLSFATHIRQIVANGESVVFGGAGTAPGQVLQLPFASNSLRFIYAATSYDDASKNEYQYMLEGYDKDWSNWTPETYKDYTGLPAGKYRFLVRARNIYRRTGETAVCTIQVLPPFYLSWWAYLVYALLIGAVIYVLRQKELKWLQRKMEREMKQMEFEKLKELDQLKSRFFANISHEFRTPLTLILGPVDNLLAAKPGPEQTRQFHLIRRNAERLLRLVNQLLDLSKLDAGKMKLDLRFADILPLVKGVMFSFDSQTAPKNIRLIFESDVERIFLYFDSDKMEQVFTNLVSNAVKFTPEGGMITVSVAVTEENKWLQIAVSDTGPGIPEEQLRYIFDRFYQGVEASRIDAPGTGIGLALTKELVELHRGQIDVTSQAGHGTSFRVRLPFGEGQAQVLPQIAEAAELDRENTLLLVEDNPDMRAFIREILADLYRVVEAADGQEGVEMALELIPDLIISDVMMPRKDGLELCQILKADERTSHIPVVLLTAKSGLESRLAGLERGADDYLSKPFNRDELLLRARNLLEWRQKLRARYADMHDPVADTEDKGVQIEDAFLQRIRNIIEQHLSDVTFEIDQLGQLVGMSRSQLFRKIKALTGQSPSLYIRAIRLNRGRELLQSTDMNVSEVAYEVGFSTPAYFSDAFTEAFGIRPSQVKK